MLFELVGYALSHEDIEHRTEKEKLGFTSLPNLG